MDNIPGIGFVGENDLSQLQINATPSRRFLTLFAVWLSRRFRKPRGDIVSFQKNTASSADSVSKSAKPTPCSLLQSTHRFPLLVCTVLSCTETEHTL
jgi:hypothetical protein